MINENDRESCERRQLPAARGGGLGQRGVGSRADGGGRADRGAAGGQEHSGAFCVRARPSRDRAPHVRAAAAAQVPCDGDARPEWLLAAPPRGALRF